MRLGNLGGTIMLEDKPILSFKYLRDSLVSMDIIDLTVRPIPPEFLLPKVIEERHVRCFFEERIVPDTRIGIHEELAKTPIEYYDPERIIRYQEGRCIHDLFWLDCDNDDTCWK